MRWAIANLSPTSFRFADLHHSLWMIVRPADAQERSRADELIPDHCRWAARPEAGK
jgi:hypothetical protein